MLSFFALICNSNCEHACWKADRDAAGDRGETNIYLHVRKRADQMYLKFLLTMFQNHFAQRESRVGISPLTPIACLRCQLENFLVISIYEKIWFFKIVKRLKLPIWSMEAMSGNGKLKINNFSIESISLLSGYKKLQSSQNGISFKERCGWLSIFVLNFLWSRMKESFIGRRKKAKLLMGKEVYC